jgi:hypothetical protein
MSETKPTIADLTLEGETESKRKAPWGDGVFLRVLFPCQVHQNPDGSWAARCREMGLVTSNFGNQESALDNLRVSIRTWAVSSAKQRVVR